MIDIADNMEIAQMKKVFEMSLKNKKIPKLALIPHSDRGMQYCSAEYVRIATENQVTISMTENSDPYENALAERMNMTMKDEFGLGKVLASKE